MRIDIGNALASEAEPGVPGPELGELDDRVEAAHDRIERERAAGTFGYAALDLPGTADPAAIREAVAPVAGAETVLTVGIGGSALGARTIAAALGDADRAPTLDNVDPAYVDATLDGLDLSETAVHVVSKSGTTAETVRNFRIVREAIADAGLDWTERTVVTTGPDGRLREAAETHDLPVLDVPEGVPGRFAALSPVGLVAPAILGHDIEAVLAGGRAVELSGSLYDCPAYAYGAVAHALEERGASANVMMPYAERLEAFAEWFAQLWAESLGKAGRGQTPVRALGVTDQHSQLQLYRAGPRDKLVSLLRPSADTEGPLAELFDAEFRATEASLAAAGRPNVRVELDGLDARSVGGLLYSMEAACVLAGELAGVETFTQPDVEWIKAATDGILEGDPPPEVAEKRRLVVD